MADVRSKLQAAAEFILNPRFLLCFGLGWLCTNGWSYILFGLGTLFRAGWMIAVSSAYMAFLWFPCTPEKLITLLIAIFLLRKLFPRDRRTLTRLKLLRRAALRKWRAEKEKWRLARKAAIPAGKPSSRRPG